MKTTMSPYDVCRRYIADYPEASEYIPTLLGYIRSRSADKLASCTSLLGDSTLYSISDRKLLMQVEAFFKKNASIEFGIDTEAAAMETFSKAEALCAETNSRLVSFYIERGSNNPDLIKKFSRAKFYIRRTLGAFSDFMDVLPSMIRVTSGATSTRSRKNSLPFNKVRTNSICTPSCRPYYKSLLRYYGFDRCNPRTTDINRVITVPKNWKTDRTIACEPEGNLPFQLAFDTFAKGRLARNGIDLSNQQRNQQLARQGSIDGSLATIDLSMASDTLARDLVALLLPKEWHDYLDNVRSPCYVKNGTKHIYEKFSSMGNGATFALETLIFASLCYAVGSKAFSVYGDDIIIETELAEELIALLNFCGFSVNTDKSYISGPFRESCGKHWMNGIDITPLFFRTNGTSKSDLCLLVNNCMQLGHVGSSLWEYAKDIIISASLPLVPINSNPTSGVWVDVTSAYALKLIVSKRGNHLWVPMFKSYINSDKHKRIVDSRTYFLWFLQKNYRWSERAVETTSVPLLNMKYVRKWVGYFPVSQREIPVQLYSWADYIIPLIK